MQPFDNYKNDSLVSAAATILEGKTHDECLQEAQSAKFQFPLAKKAMEAVRNLDEDELEDFLFALDSFFEEGEMSDYKESSNISALIYKAAQIWKNRNERYA
jgi:hypothetical protein